MKDFEIETNDLVYIPAEDTFLLAENLEIKESDTVLEIGTGTGTVGLFASKLTNSQITVTDINFDALELARVNFSKNNIENVEFVFGNLFDELENRKFDVILFNTPYLPTEEDDIIDDNLNYAFDGGADGRKIIDPFLYEVKNHLNKGGLLQLIQSSLSDINKTFEILSKEGFMCEVAASEHFFFEDIVLINAYLL
ncbi:HemK2/MTQ2 family protein methyltransferase [uncultured Methanobrevibacter sp.]|uniref:HemK2/MTQ2 family protein methyltransferase n=1 Tax=uncultured Methanobrevibacter sp. TaxID=253161 RepID=UPI0025E52A48|nr:HemK2/MTQ2 family protein methyltransferase [uncultured Methanobrevibacter sp.]